MDADLMKFDARQVVLFVVSELGDRRNGKTFIQKVCFFVGRLTGHRLGFGPHFYGPYSDDVSAEIAYLVGGDLLVESRQGSGVVGETGWELAHIGYCLTDKGRDGLGFLEAKHPTESALVRSAVRQVLSAGPLDYVELSVAAKAVWIEEANGKSLDPGSIASAATRFGWLVSGKQVERASEFLRKLDCRDALLYPL